MLRHMAANFANQKLLVNPDFLIGENLSSISY